MPVRHAPGREFALEVELRGDLNVARSAGSRQADCVQSAETEAASASADQVRQVSDLAGGIERRAVVEAAPLGVAPGVVHFKPELDEPHFALPERNFLEKRKIPVVHSR